MSHRPHIILCRAAAHRAFDVALALLIALAALPVLIATALAVALEMGRPVLFRQTRIGRQENPFLIFKFRTMLRDPGRGGVATDAPRLTALGRWLRKTSLDELPQLWNVLKGDMALVGPRPLLPEYLPRYTAAQRRRHEVRPGLTGWAQVHGRNALSWEDKFRLDVWYVDHRSLWLDGAILALTFKQVLTGRGVASAGQATTFEFHGSIAPE